MQLWIRHETAYAYTAPQAYSIQQLHLTPRVEAQQHVLSWQLSAAGQMHGYTDAYGNLSHMLTLNAPHQALTIVASGAVETTAPPGGRIAGNDTLPPMVYTMPTRLTAVTPEITHLAAGCAAGAVPTTNDCMQLAACIAGAVHYQSGSTAVGTTAGAALALGAGVCQDHAHVFLACCHVNGWPARYVSGYIDPGNTGHAASHAWVDVWADDGSDVGWVSVDVTHVRLMTDAYCRLAVGRDYDSAAPVRGIRRGGGDETMAASVQVAQQ
ncbi:transglutaminase family protein [Pseudoduganella ginsengisoli]|uniref:Transglutaminase family protein n=1 Tax=Pseudoduganella ginsengisoli TaxID=1462440 RepID=A0A6L6Q240_9BURK|nr:transglutaminase family protein [Pseudoduganella ginsengisoli]MTW03700.1 transglutaminase family protein [Pseudoduganella ginsengisoli]